MIETNKEEITQRAKLALANYDLIYDPTFVIGCPRSGTTLLARIIATHPEYAYLEELRFLSLDMSLRVAIANLARAASWKLLPFPFFDYIHNLKLQNHNDRYWKIAMKIDSFLNSVLKIRSPYSDIERLTKHILASAYMDTPPTLKPSNPLREIYSLDALIPPHLVPQFVEKYMGIPSFANRIRIMFKDFSILSGGKRVIEKTPGEDLIVMKLLDIFPKAKLLHIFRDGRDVIASLLFSDNFYGSKKRKPWRKACQTWLESCEAVKILPKLCPKENYMQIRYEDLLDNLRTYCNKIFEFLNVQSSEITLIKIEEISGKELRSRWNEDMTNKLRNNVNKYLAKGLRDLGYKNKK